MDELLFEYCDKFGENFPIYSLMGTPENEVIHIIKDCIKNNKVYAIEEGKIY